MAKECVIERNSLATLAARFLTILSGLITPKTPISTQLRHTGRHKETFSIYWFHLISNSIIAKASSKHDIMLLGPCAGMQWNCQKMGPCITKIRTVFVISATGWACFLSFVSGTTFEFYGQDLKGQVQTRSDLWTHLCSNPRLWSWAKSLEVCQTGRKPSGRPSIQLDGTEVPGRPSTHIIPSGLASLSLR